MLQTTLISVILIFLVHHLIQFFRDTLTTPKIKDLVNTPPIKYEHMFSAMNYSNQPSIQPINASDIKNLLPVATNAPGVPTAMPVENNYDSLTMKNELKNYLKNQSFSTPISNIPLESNYTHLPKKIKITELV
jgi:hypothetical protein